MVEASRAEMNRPSFLIDICRSILVLSTALSLLAHLTWGADHRDPSWILRCLEAGYWTLSLGALALLAYLDSPRERQLSHGFAVSVLLAYSYFLRLPVLTGRAHSLAYHESLTRFFSSTGWYFGSTLGLPVNAMAGLAWVVLVSFWVTKQAELSFASLGWGDQQKARIRDGTFGLFLLLLGLLLLRYATGSISPLPSH